MRYDNFAIYPCPTIWTDRKSRYLYSVQHVIASYTILFLVYLKEEVSFDEQGKLYTDINKHY